MFENLHRGPFVAVGDGIGLQGSRFDRRMTVGRGPVSDGNARRCDFAVQPILLVGERAPSRFHALVAIEDGLAGRTLGKMRAVLGIFAEDFRLLHGFLPFWKKTYEGKARLQRSSNEGSVTIGTFTPRHKAATGDLIQPPFIVAIAKTKRPALSSRPFKIHQLS
jgi:hypothetical protein